MTTSRRLRELLARPGIIKTLAPHDVFTARLLEQAGFEMLFLGVLSNCFFNSFVGTMGTTLATTGVVAATTLGCWANKFVVDKLITISNKILYIMVGFGYFFYRVIL